jgi:VanZ family protein
MPIPETPLSHVRFIDKWTHIALYFCTCGVIWTEYLRRHPLKQQPSTFSWRKLIRWGWFAPILMSGLIELAQAYCTGGRRSGEWLDFLANASGATLMLGVGTLWVWYRARG